MSQPQSPRLRRKLTQEEMTVYQRGTQCDRGGARCGGRSSSEWVQDKAREVPWPTRQSEEAGVWSRGSPHHSSVSRWLRRASPGAAASPEQLGWLSTYHLVYRTRFLTIGTIDIWGWIILRCGRLPCALCDVQQHPWPLPRGSGSQICLRGQARRSLGNKVTPD